MPAVPARSRRLLRAHRQTASRLYREYPRTAFLHAVTLAQQYGLFDLDRLERLTLRVIAKDYFILSDDDGEPQS